MEYRNLGKAGVKVSEIGLGSWLTYGGATENQIAEKCIDRAYELGINFFDTANVYAAGKAEEVVGKSLSKYRRDSYVLRPKFSSRWATARTTKDFRASTFSSSAICR